MGADSQDPVEECQHRAPSHKNIESNPLELTIMKPTMLASAFVLAAASCQAAITFQSAVTVSSPSDVSTAGALVQALSFASSTTVNGVAFSGPNVHTGSGNPYTNGIFEFNGVNNLNNFAFGAGSGNPWNSLAANYQSLLSGSVYSGPLGSSFTVNLNGLTIGQEGNLVQLWVNDNRGGSIALRNQEVEDGNVAAMDFNHSDEEGGIGKHVIGTFTANSNSESFRVNGAIDSVAQINAIQLRTIPEPSSAFLGAAAAGLLVLRRRRTGLASDTVSFLIQRMNNDAII